MLNTVILALRLFAAPYCQVEAVEGKVMYLGCGPEAESSVVAVADGHKVGDRLLLAGGR